MKRTFLCLLMLAAAGACGSQPFTEPDRFGIPTVIVSCDHATDAELNCRVPVVCADIYPCKGQLPPDVTATATWSVDDSSIAQVVTPGTLMSVGVGNTVVRASAASFGSGSHTVAVFGGTVPLPTFSLQGFVYSGTNRATGGIDGATIEVVSGLIAGRRAVSGAAPDPVPGFVAIRPAVAGTFILNGVPAGTIRLRVTAAGYHPLERDVTFTLSGASPGSIDFQLLAQ